MHRLAHLIMGYQAAEAELPGPITSSVVRPGGHPRAAETEVLLALLSRAEWRARRIDALVRAVEGLAEREPVLAQAVWWVCLEAPARITRASVLHDPKAKDAAAARLRIDPATLWRYIDRAWEYLGVMWGPQEELEAALRHRQAAIDLTEEELAWALQRRA